MGSNIDLFVCEFITGGGLYNQPLPPSLAHEGDLMLHALLADLLELPGVQLTTTRDVRLPALRLPVRVIPVEGDPWPLWQRCIAAADALWPIAPESGGTLRRLTDLAQGKLLLGCDADSVAIAASKLATARHLARHGVDVVPTCTGAGFMPTHGPHVAKPDDGAGCEDARVFDDPAQMMEWLAQGRLQSHVIQPWLEGEAASLSLLCLHGQACLLSCNRQLIEVDAGRIHYRGSQLNAMAPHWAASEDVAHAVARTLPGLAGYVGVDVVIDGGRVTVLEINPRLTTSYVGLKRAIGCNPARLVLDLFYNGHMVDVAELQRNEVEVVVDG